MAFKKKNDLKKKAKKKAKLRNKENKQDGWTHEGGVTIENSDDKNELKKKRYHTQEADEKLRRSRVKIHHHKLQRDFVKKMSNKVKFSDILNSYKKDDESDDEEEQNGQKKRQRIEPPPPNRTPVFDRLTRMLNKNKNEFDIDSDEEQNNNTDDEHDELLENGEEIDSDNDYSDNDESDNDFKPLFSSQHTNLKLNKEEDKIINDSDNDSDSDNEINNKKMISFFDNFFKSNHIKINEDLIKKNKKNKKIKEIYNNISKNNDLLYSNLDQTSIISNYFNSDNNFTINSISELNDLNRLWKNNTDKLNIFASNILPCLSSYSDVIIEGVNYQNEHVISETCIMHLLFHLVKSRSKVIMHNKKLKAKAKLASLKLKGEIVISDDENEGDSKPNTSNKSNNQDSTELVPTSSRSTRKAKRREFQATEPAPLPTASTRKRLDDSDDEDKNNTENNEDHIRDQGFTRARILILCPYRKSAAQIVHTIFNILGPNTSISNLDKFEQDFADPESDDESDDEYFAQFSTKKQKNFLKNRSKTEKPTDWQHVFKGNMDDDFKLGLQINPLQGKGNGKNKGVYLKLFTDFYLSDIIIASPLGLKLALEKESNKAGSSDFLTSIEQVYIHQGDVLYMQNWDHIQFIFDHLNLMPQTLGFNKDKKNNDKVGLKVNDKTDYSNNSIIATDFSRVREYFLHNKSKFYRQLIFTSSFLSPDMLTFLRLYSTNHLGSFRLKKTWNKDGELSNIKQLYTIKQVFQKLPEPQYFLKNTNLIEESNNTKKSKNSDKVSETNEKLVNNLLSYEEVRFKYFVNVVLKKILLLNDKHIILFVPNYFDFVKVRNELIKQEVSAVFVSEYSRESEISRGRARFFQGLKNILVYSGRAHFFRRFPIRGGSHIIFYSPPEYSHFYSELLNLLAPPIKAKDRMITNKDDNTEIIDEDENEYTSNLTSLCLFADYDMLSLSRIVGSDRAKQMIESNKDSFVFF